MSTFSCPVVKYKLSKHPNADRLSIAEIKGWSCVVNTQDFETNNLQYKDLNLGVYIPLDAVAPKDHPLLGFLEGKKVKTQKLRGSISQGVLLPLQKVVETYLLKKFPEEGDNMADILGVKKWEEPIKPQKLSTGGVLYAEVSRPSWLGSIYDIENWNNYPDVIKEGELVSISEKLHGCCSTFALIEGVPYICSRKRALRVDDKIIRVPKFENKYIKKLLKLLKLNNLNIFTKEKIIPPEDTVWHRIYKQYNIYYKLLKLSKLLGENVALYGEIYGSIQTLTYGFNKGELDFRVFDIKAGESAHFLAPEETEKLCSEIGLPHVPIFYKGPFKQELLELRNGTTTLMDKNPHIREGIVIKPLVPRYDHKLGRVVLKRVSEKYLLGDHSDY